MNQVIKSAKRQRREAFMTQQDDNASMTTTENITDEQATTQSKPDPVEPWQWVIFIMIFGGGGLALFVLWMDSLLGT